LATFLSSTKWGRHTVAWIAAALIILMAAGLYPWWPPNRNWRSAFMPERGARGLRRLLDFHNLAAVCLFVPLLILVFTGVYLSYPGWIVPAVSLVSVARTPDPDALAREPCQRRLLFPQGQKGENPKLWVREKPVKSGLQFGASFASLRGLKFTQEDLPSRCASS